VGGWIKKVSGWIKSPFPIELGPYPKKPLGYRGAKTHKGPNPGGKEKRHPPKVQPGHSLKTSPGSTLEFGSILSEQKRGPQKRVPGPLNGGNTPKGFLERVEERGGGTGLGGPTGENHKNEPTTFG